MVGRNPILYEALLVRPELEKHHLQPLEGVPDEAWAKLAAVALEKGLEPEDIAYASFHMPHTIAGHGLDYWGKWEKAFTLLETRTNGALREVARHGRRIAEKHLETAKERQRQEELYGYR